MQLAEKWNIESFNPHRLLQQCEFCNSSVLHICFFSLWGHNKILEVMRPQILYGNVPLSLKQLPRKINVLRKKMGFTFFHEAMSLSSALSLYYEFQNNCYNNYRSDFLKQDFRIGVLCAYICVLFLTIIVVQNK